MPTSPSFPPPSFGAARVEHDLLGDLTVPAAACYGVQTVRALDNCKITGSPLSHFPQSCAPSHGEKGNRGRSAAGKYDASAQDPDSRLQLKEDSYAHRRP